MGKIKRLKTERFTFFRREIERLEFHIPLIIKELRTGRHPCAVLGTYGFTFVEDIERLKEYLCATERQKLAAKL